MAEKFSWENRKNGIIVNENVAGSTRFLRWAMFNEKGTLPYRRAISRKASASQTWPLLLRLDLCLAKRRDDLRITTKHVLAILSNGEQFDRIALSFVLERASSKGGV